MSEPRGRAGWHVDTRTLLPSGRHRRHGTSTACLCLASGIWRLGTQDANMHADLTVWPGEDVRRRVPSTVNRGDDALETHSRALRRARHPALPSGNLLRQGRRGGGSRSAPHLVPVPTSSPSPSPPPSPSQSPSPSPVACRLSPARPSLISAGGGRALPVLACVALSGPPRSEIVFCRSGPHSALVPVTRCAWGRAQRNSRRRCQARTCTGPVF